jgi:hypothetical protein
MTIPYAQSRSRDNPSPSTPAVAAGQPLKSPSPAKHWPMVGWFHPPQLVSTGIAIAISAIFGRHSDHRLIEALASNPSEIYDYTCHYRENDQDLCEPDASRPRQEIWIDYVGDVGDGWNSTYAIAYELAQQQRTFTYHDGTGRECQAKTGRGEILIFGGDEVYPTASREAYEQRLLGPYETALRYSKGPPYPHVFAIPGNHDWYDSLAAFIRMFTSRHWLAGWRTRQHRSYFALKLPHGWWLLGTDVQLGSDIDRPQMEYFERVAVQMQPEDRIILCHAEPHWVYEKMYEDLDPAYNESNLALLEKRLKGQVAVFLAGDQHHYRRYEATDGSSTQKITAGGGGASLHPTHTGRRGKDLTVLVEKAAAEIGQRAARTFRQRRCFPTEDESRKLCWLVLIFPYLSENASWTFGFATAGLYWLSSLAFLANMDRFTPWPGGRSLPCPDCWQPLGPYDHHVLAQLTGAALDTVLGSPLMLCWALLLTVGFILFTDTHSRRYRWIAGPIHALGHVGAAFVIALGAISLVLMLTSSGWGWAIRWGGHLFSIDLRPLVASVLVALGGFIVGPFITGLYLLVSLNGFGRHWNEAFSALAIQDWKHFLRLHIDAEGHLTIYPIGIRRVPRRWEPRQGDVGPELVPKDPNATDPALIERPIVLRCPTAIATGVTDASPGGLKPEPRAI